VYQDGSTQQHHDEANGASVKRSDKIWSLPVTGGALGAFAALAIAVPVAHADPDVPPPVPGPGDQSITTQAAAGDPALPAPPAEVPHLSSPENLPPGTSDVPVDQGQSRTGSYLRDLWHAVQTQDISGKDALLLFTQRPLDPNAMPTNGLPAGPQAPLPDAPPPDAQAPDAPMPGAPAPGPVPPGPAPVPAPDVPTP
jgi:hypothetical protein